MLDHCIVGAGPGGLQLGHLLHAAGRDYTLFEKASSAGSFFKRHPRHRKLISLNKRFTGRDNAEFNLRHDWNSLLDNNDTVPMTRRTKERWPPADILVEYLQDFAQQQEQAGRIQYDTEVRSISTEPALDGPSTFIVEVASGGATRQVNCRLVVVATGLSVPNAPSTIKGIELTQGYEDLPVNGESYVASALHQHVHWPGAAWPAASCCNQVPWTCHGHAMDMPVRAPARHACMHACVHTSPVAPMGVDHRVSFLDWASH